MVTTRRGIPDIAVAMVGFPMTVPRRMRLPLGLMLTRLIVWSVMACGAYLLVDAVLGRLADLVGPLADAGTGVVRWLGLRQHATALRDVANIEGRAGELIGVSDALQRPGVIIL